MDMSICDFQFPNEFRNLWTPEFMWIFIQNRWTIAFHSAPRKSVLCDNPGFFWLTNQKCQSALITKSWPDVQIIGVDQFWKSRIILKNKYWPLTTIFTPFASNWLKFKWHGFCYGISFIYQFYYFWIATWI